MARLNSAVRLVPACYFDLIRTNSSRNVSIGRFRFREGGMIPSSEGEEEMAHTILWFIIGSEKLAHNSKPDPYEQGMLLRSGDKFISI